MLSSPWKHDFSWPPSVLSVSRGLCTQFGHSSVYISHSYPHDSWASLSLHFILTRKSVALCSEGCGEDEAGPPQGDGVLAGFCGGCGCTTCWRSGVCARQGPGTCSVGTGQIWLLNSVCWVRKEAAFPGHWALCTKHCGNAGCMWPLS